MYLAGGAAVLVIAALGAVLLIRSAAPSTTIMTVELAVYDDFDGCDLGFGYSDVPGSSVTIRADGAFAGSGSLGRVGKDDVISCTFTARIAGVPTDARFYTIEIGRRGTGDATKSELEATNWTYRATLGL